MKRANNARVLTAAAASVAAGVIGLAPGAGAAAADTQLPPAPTNLRLSGAYGLDLTWDAPVTSRTVLKYRILDNGYSARLTPPGTLTRPPTTHVNLALVCTLGSGVNTLTVQALYRSDGTGSPDTSAPSASVTLIR